MKRICKDKHSERDLKCLYCDLLYEEPEPYVFTPSVRCNHEIIKKCKDGRVLIITQVRGKFHIYGGWDY